MALITVHGVDINRSEIVVDVDDIDYVEAGPIQGSVVATKNGNYFDVVEMPDAIEEMMNAAT